MAATASATSVMPARRCFHSPDWSCPTATAVYNADMRSTSSSLDAGGPSVISASSTDEDETDAPDVAALDNPALASPCFEEAGLLPRAVPAPVPAPEDVPGLGRPRAVEAPPSPLVPGRTSAPFTLDRTAAGGLAAAAAPTPVPFESRVVRGSALPPPASPPLSPPLLQSSSIFRFFASSSASMIFATALPPPAARAMPAMASSAAARTSGVAASAHLTTAGSRVLTRLSAAALPPRSSPLASATHCSVCSATLGTLCPSAAATSSVASPRTKQCRTNCSSASWIRATTEVFLSLSLSSIPGSMMRASRDHSLRADRARFPAAATASPTHAMLASLVTTFLSARATSP
mmetsp:Transcript_27954/g.70235  ORF Transcript_27954/g.70235 Transcript_27954/m.70235 type:complete len:348 (-) Transcript_27954:189-1232(-)